MLQFLGRGVFLIQVLGNAMERSHPGVGEGWKLWPPAPGWKPQDLQLASGQLGRLALAGNLQ